MFQQKISADRIGGIVCIVFGALAVSESIRLYPTRMDSLVGDHTMPGIVGVIMILLGLLLVFTIKGKQVKVQFPDRKMMLNMLFTLILMFFYWFLLPYLGYVIITLLVSIGLFKVIGSYNLLKSSIFAVILTVCLYLLFIFWLKMPFPTGFLTN